MGPLPSVAHDLLKPLDPLDIESVYQHGVIVPIEVVRTGDLPVVSLGRGRVRKARLANVRRKEAGLPLIAVKFTVVRITDGVQLLSRMIDENLRRKTIGVLDQIDLAKQMLARGASEEQTAKQLGITMVRFRQWLQLEDNATEPVRQALREDRLSASAAIEIAALDADRQNEALAQLLSSPKPSTRAAKRLVRKSQGKEDAPVPPSRAEQRRMAEALDAATRGNSDDWMRGARAAVKWVLGEASKADAKALASVLASSE